MSELSILPDRASSVAAVEERIVALATLHRTIASCRRCVDAGHIERACPIFRGEVGNRLMIVGQAPAAPDSERPLPYSGASGRTLRAWLGQVGFSPGDLHERCYLTSLTKCYPGASKGGKGDRPPSAAEIELCREHLDGELTLIRPAVVLTLGRLAAVALCRGSARGGPAPTLTELVGTVQDAERAGVRMLVLPLPHPSGVSHWLNDPSNRERLARGLALLANLRRDLGL